MSQNYEQQLENVSGKLLPDQNLITIDKHSHKSFSLAGGFIFQPLAEKYRNFVSVYLQTCGATTRQIMYLTHHLLYRPD